MEIKQFAMLFLLLAAILSNLPFVSDRLFGFLYLTRCRKSTVIRLLEWLVLYGLWIITAGLVEQYIGQLHLHDWSMWVVSLTLFATLAFPGIVARYLWTSKNN